MQQIQNFFSFSQSKNFFDNEKYIKKLKKIETILPNFLFVLLKNVFDDSIKEKDLEEKAQYQNMLKKAKLPKSISQITSTFSQINEYSNILIQNKIKELSQTLPLFRKIRGDGNCFYRAIGVGYLEQLFFKFWSDLQKDPNTINEKNELFEFLMKVKEIHFIECKLSESFNEKSYKIIDKIFKRQKIFYHMFLRECCRLIMITYKEKNIKVLLEIIESSFVNNYLFDMSVVIVMRNIIYLTLKNNLNREEYAPFVVNPDEYFKKLEIFGEEAENILIPITSDTIQRNIIINIVHVDRMTGKPTILREDYEPLLNGGGEKKKCENLHLYFRPGHYDLGYEKEHFFNQLFNT